MKAIILLLGFLAALTLAERVRYDGFSLIRTKISSEQLSQLENKFPVDIWYQHGTTIDLLISPSNFSAVAAYLETFNVVQGDIQRQIDLESAAERVAWKGVGTRAGFFDSFRPYSEFVKYFDDLIAAYPSLLSKRSIGTTIQGNDIIELKLTTGGSKPVLYFEATVHAREWLAPTTALFTLVNLLEKFSSGDQTAIRLVEALEWRFACLVNVDGYLYTWSNDRLWRKNRRQNSGSSFYGVDLNRNFGPTNTWCSSGSSTSPSSDTYCGTSAFSEPETKATSNAFASVDLAGLIAFHCYGPLILRPYQYTYNAPPEPYNTLVTNLGKSMETAINAVHRARYESIQGSDLYPHSGGSIDWTYLTKNVPAFTVEIRGNSFIVPATEIILAGEENYAGVVVLAQSVLSR